MSRTTFRIYRDGVLVATAPSCREAVSRATAEWRRVRGPLSRVEIRETTADGVELTRLGTADAAYSLAYGKREARRAYATAGA